jgi:sterol desaturase/sphingolipid hydroxylase (fatty acid hydroxylase superfamily)
MGLLDLTDECHEAIERWNGVVGPPDPANRKKESLRVFKNDFVENWLATSHPALPIVWFGGIIAYGAVSSALTPLPGIPLFFLGILLWTLLEYTLHRFAFHARPGASVAAKLNLFMIHGYHHEFPDDRWRLVAPPLMSFPIAAVVALVYRLAAGEMWWPLFGGTVLGYLAYDWIHYYTHHFTPTTTLGKYMRRIHLVHHYADGEKNMGISSPLWDFVFRTYQGRGKTAAS